MILVDEWEQAIIEDDYGAFTAGPARMVGHCTDGRWGAIQYNIDASRPHYHTVHVVRPASQRKTVQLCPLDRTSGGLAKPPAGRITNHRTALQWSIAGPADEMHTLTEEECIWLGMELRPFLRHYPSITMDHLPAVGPGDHSGPIATPTWSGRYSWAMWDALNGWTQHQRVTGNSHYDIYCHEWQFQLIIDTAHIGANVAKIDDLHELLFQNYIDFEAGKPGYTHPSGQDAVSRWNETAARVGAGRGKGDILTPIHQLATDVKAQTDTLEASMATVIAKLNQLLARPTGDGGGLTDVQVRDIVRQEIDKTKLGT